MGTVWVRYVTVAVKIFYSISPVPVPQQWTEFISFETATAPVPYGYARALSNSTVRFGMASESIFLLQVSTRGQGYLRDYGRRVVQLLSFDSFLSCFERACSNSIQTFRKAASWIFCSRYKNQSWYILKERAIAELQNAFHYARRLAKLPTQKDGMSQKCVSYLRNRNKTRSFVRCQISEEPVFAMRVQASSKY